MATTVKGPLLPKIGKTCIIGHVSDLGHSKTHINKLRRYVIDNPRDEGLKRRETLWDFQQKHRGALVKVKGDGTGSGKEIINDQDNQKLTKGDESQQPPPDKSSEIEKGRNLKAAQFKKFKRKQRLESRVVLGTTPVDLPEVHKDPSVTYSTSLRIGNSIYNQMKGDEQTTTASHNTMYSDAVKKAIVRSIDKLPDLSASLTKLGYLKVAKNVVRYGGGFFGRYSFDRPYAKIKRSWTNLTPPDVRARIHGRILAPTTAPVDHKSKVEKTTTLIKKRLEYLDTLSIQQSSSFKTSTISSKDDNCSVSTADNSSKRTVKTLISCQTTSTLTYSDDNKRSLPILDQVRKRERRLRSLKDQQQTRMFEPVVTKQNLEEKKENTEKKVFIDAVDTRQRKLANLQRERSKAKSDMEHLKREVSEQGLDLPKDKYGPTTHLRDNKRPALYGSNPYRWTSKTCMSLDDHNWIKRTMQQADVVDNSAYDSFARIKPAALQKGNTDLVIQKRPIDNKKN